MKLKTPPGPLLLAAEDGEGDRGGRGGPPLGFHGEAPFSAFRIPVLCSKVSEGDQSHFEAAGASFVCEGCEALPK